ncbi:ATP phosphoribosyltransferase regulatory subunit [Effusibacillus lacus]|uniref:ATP phosphoribosyltransferase regulatory subunit n=1 Tax=Effusibacillus lacus TaxID=1348429 RepID=A0A292YIC7_9BACL|nr:ATP phosphoribosyltransferase regulatory subunit [Effusibacillus lacus]TCS74196.1 ATP phosphoribosyltransferase regulatory subunit [Effusibacillus lacus]GAX90807.1 ATP phosphoribosyltransferase regulatory subunit [Effusibacillus lacus]
MQKPLLFEKPQGVRDFLPDTAANKRQLEREISHSFARWGYREIITPMFEYMDTFQTGIRGAEDRVFKFVDRSGRMMALRVDMTAPIARVVASLMKNWSLPIRLSYTANIFRQQDLVAGRDTEFTQAGVELIGDATPDADAEMLALAVSTLKEIGLEGFRLALGQVGFLQGMLEEHVAEESTRERLQNALADKDYVAFERIVETETEEPGSSVLLQIPRLRGGVEVLARAREMTGNRKAKDALQNLEDIWRILQIHGVTDYVQIDLSLWLGLNYYTGAIFEGYAPMMGFPICGGGRYDDLVEKFGRETPATGFIIGIERVMEILEKKGTFAPQQRYLLCYTQEDRETALKFAEYLRNRGIMVSAKLISEEEKLPAVEGSDSILVRQDSLETDDSRLQDLYLAFQNEGEESQ